MAAFLEQTAAYLVSSYGDDISDICIVLPNLRAGLFLRKSIAGLINKTIWAPAICSAEDFMTTVSGLKPFDKQNLVFSLYGIHQDLEKEKAQPFEDFIQWAPQLLADFDEADRYLADTRQLFAALTDARAITVWNPENRPLTDFEKQYIKFYNSLYHYYSRLVDQLLASRQAWPGLIFRMAALGIEQFSETLPWKKIVFAGFNAISASEEKVMDILHSKGQAEFLWDADEYYLNDYSQEAGEFMRYNRKKWGGREFRWVTKGIAALPMKISITGMPNNTAQASFAGEILRSSAAFDEHTAIVVLDENLLIPLLYSLPDKAGEMNITMGLPLSQTPLASLFGLLFRMQMNKDKFTANRKNGAKHFYYKDVLALLRHPYISGMASSLMHGNRFVFDSLLASIVQGNRIFISAEEILNPGTGLFSANADFLKPFFGNWLTPAEALVDMREILSSLRDRFISDPGGLEIEYIFAVSKIHNQADRLIQSHPGTVKSVKTLSLLFTRMLETETLPFFGEPLKGMQIMGLHETRGLDFDNIIMLSCNEGLLPRGRSSGSFIPLDLKLEFGLPTYRQKDAVYAYQFYHLLQRTVNISLLYNSEPGEFGGGEMSRYLQQLISELKNANPSAVIKEEILVMMPEPSGLVQEIIIPKGEKVLNLLKIKAVKGFSPTTLNNFRTCSLKFYFSDLALLQEPDETEEEIDSRILGNIIHEALHRLYKEFQGQDIGRDEITEIRTRAGRAIDEACGKEFKGRDVNYGRNLLLLNVGKMMLKKFLDHEMRLMEEMKKKGEVLSIIGLELWMERQIGIRVGEEEINVRVKGKADRIENTGKCLRVIDYKTGSTDPGRTSIENWDAFHQDSAKDHAFQLLAYAWLYFPRLRSKLPVEAGILSLRNPKDGLIAVSVPSAEGEPLKTLLEASDINEFENSLKQILTAIYDPSVPFTQTTDLNVCSKCIYIDLCGR
ncbi:MAG: PD-(D/E)XK nuclease family protein [Bacteroidota bacterium]